jgi:hypothetical protein
LIFDESQIHFTKFFGIRQGLEGLYPPVWHFPRSPKINWPGTSTLWFSVLQYNLKLPEQW